jgi:hypothetical protein
VGKGIPRSAFWQDHFVQQFENDGQAGGLVASDDGFPKGDKSILGDFLLEEYIQVQGFTLERVRKTITWGMVQVEDDSQPGRLAPFEAGIDVLESVFAVNAGG